MEFRDAPAALVAQVYLREAHRHQREHDRRLVDGFSSEAKGQLEMANRYRELAYDADSVPPDSMQPIRSDLLRSDELPQTKAHEGTVPENLRAMAGSSA
jgi:hypothetical protein